MQYQQNEWQRHGKKWRTSNLKALGALYGVDDTACHYPTNIDKKLSSEEIYPLEKGYRKLVESDNSHNSHKDA